MDLFAYAGFGNICIRFPLTCRAAEAANLMCKMSLDPKGVVSGQTKETIKKVSAAPNGRPNGVVASIGQWGRLWGSRITARMPTCMLALTPTSITEARGIIQSMWALMEQNHLTLSVKVSGLRPEEGRTKILRTADGGGGR